MAKILLVDGFNLVFRAFYGMPNLSRPDGFPTGAVHGWVRTLWKLQDDEAPDRMVVLFDLGGAHRQTELLPQYKANRTEAPEDLVRQIPVIKELTRDLGWGALECEGVEADDLIASCALREAAAGHEVLIVSADKDLGQLVDERVQQLLPPPTANPKAGWRRLGPQGVLERFGVRPAQIPDLLALTGDTSDNIPGLDGVGLKTAARWLSQFGTLEGVIDHCGELKPQRFQALVHESRDLLRRNLRLTTLDPATAVSIDWRVIPPPDLDRAVRTLTALGMTRSAEEARRRIAAFPGESSR